MHPRASLNSADTAQTALYNLQDDNAGMKYCMALLFYCLPAAARLAVQKTTCAQLLVLSQTLHHISCSASSTVLDADMGLYVLK
jgi:hypothetical protein